MTIPTSAPMSFIDEQCGSSTGIGHTRPVPEGLEVEIYRRAAVATVGRVIRSIEFDERRCDPQLACVLPGRRLTGVRRVGKWLVVETDGPDVGIHFGMTGRIVVDGFAPIDQLEYGANRDDEAWNRFVVRFDRGTMRVNDPRRWCRVTLDPDVHRLGPDLFDITLDELSTRCAHRRVTIKAVLLDQHAVAGLGNMSLDEVLFHAGIAPNRAANELSGDEVLRLHTAMRRHLPAMLERGGSHTGTLDPGVRRLLPSCPIDGTPLTKTEVAGRSSVWCMRHQR